LGVKVLDHDKGRQMQVFSPKNKAKAEKFQGQRKKQSRA